jgi:hypothetical protein
VPSVTTQPLNLDVAPRDPSLAASFVLRGQDGVLDVRFEETGLPVPCMSLLSFAGEASLRLMLAGKLVEGGGYVRVFGT